MVQRSKPARAEARACRAGLSRLHTDADLQVFLRWRADRQLDPLIVRRGDVEIFVRWLHEERRLKPSTVSRRLSVVTCFYRACVIGAVLEASPAAYVRRPPVPDESPTLGMSHLQFEAMIVAARTSTNPLGFALVAMLDSHLPEVRGTLDLRDRAHIQYERLREGGVDYVRDWASVTLINWAPFQPELAEL